MVWVQVVPLQVLPVLKVLMDMVHRLIKVVSLARLVFEILRNCDFFLLSFFFSERPLGSTDLGSQPQIAANHQLQNAGHHAQPNYPYPSPVPQPSSASGSRVARPSRLNTVYPNNQSPHSHLSVGQMAQQQQLHLQQQAQRMHVQQQQQQQMVVQQQQQQIMQQQQQLQQQQQQLQSQQQSGNHLPNGHSSSHNKRRRISDGDADEDGADEEGADGEDTTPYCFCQRPSFGEVSRILLISYNDR